MVKKRIYRKHTCGMCPKWFRGYCGIYAKIMVADHPVCEAGKKFVNNEISRLYMAAHKKK